MYDIIIIGGASAGLTAALYCARRELKTLVLTKDVGGQAAITPHIENYPGIYPTAGLQLMNSFARQAKDFGAEIKLAAVTKITPKNSHFLISTNEERYQSKTLILAYGKEPRRLGVPDEEKFEGRGISYCTTCDGPLFKGKTILVIGSGNSAMDTIIYLSKIVKKIYVATNINRFVGETVLRKKIQQIPILERTFYNSKVEKIEGKDKVEQVVLTDSQDHKYTLAVDAVFVEIGYRINNDLIDDLVKLNATGEVIVDKAGRTSVPGIFAAGDITDTPYKQIIISAGEGCKAALAANEYLTSKGKIDE